MRILNLFAGIGGNRTLWDNKHEITAVEQDQVLAFIYQKRYPQDTVIIGDAYEYCTWNYDKFDFIWASPPCPTHSWANNWLNTRSNKNSGISRRLPDTKLWSLIVYLRLMNIMNGLLIY